MRTYILMAATSLVFSSCAAVADNVSIDMDGIIASTCQSFADQLTNQLEQQLAELTSDAEVEVPDIDIEAAIDRAEGLGCSPDEMRRIIGENLDTITATSDRAKEVVDQIQAETDAG